jgi:heat shock protein HslJ
MHHLPRRAAYTSLLIAVLAGAGCGDQAGSAPAGPPAGTAGATPPAGLGDRQWLSTEVTVGGADRPVEPGTTLVVSFDDTTVSATAGCNRFGGSARWDGATLVVEGLGGTEMACPSPLMRQDEWLVDFLTSLPQVAIDDDRMTMQSGETTVSYVDGEAAIPDARLEGTAWRLESFGETGPDGAVSSVPAGVRSTLRIDGGSLGLRPGCNTGGGDVEVAADSLVVDAVFTTQMACPGARQEVELVVLDLLQGRVDYRVEGDTLTLTRGAHMLVYRAAS